MKKQQSMKLVFNRETMQSIVEKHVNSTMLGDHEVTNYKAHKDGSVEVTLTGKEAEPELPLEPLAIK